MSRIVRVDAWEVLDSRGNPTVACEVQLADGSSGIAAVPSGASTGSYEAYELRDGDPRYGGRGVGKAVANVVGKLAEVALGCDASDQRALDDALCASDGSADLSVVGANAVLSVSVASALAAATSLRVPLYRFLCEDRQPLLPMPMVNIVSGGAHAGGAVDMQDFLVIPVGAEAFSQAIEWCARVRRATAKVAEEHGLVSWLVADEGGIAASPGSNLAALELVAAGIERSGLDLGRQTMIAIDVAATEFVSADRYILRREGRSLTSTELVDELCKWSSMFPIASYEDALAEDDWEGWKDATESPLGALQLLGDDLFATNLERLEHGITGGVANAVLVKPNQAGTLTRAFDVVERARACGYATVLSARSGETEDGWLADLAVGWRTGQIKVGSTTRSERTAKWNRLLRIEHELGAEATFANPFKQKSVLN
jgi:enolase